MTSVITLLWVNYALSLSTMTCAFLISLGNPRSQLEESVKRAIGVFIAVLMAWGLWKSLTSALLYIDVSVRPVF
jgi:hypothetical protein